MSFLFQAVTTSNQQIFELLFRQIFNSNVDAHRIDIEKKLDLNHVSLSQTLSMIAYDHGGNVAGAVGLYPVYYIDEEKKLHLAAQIGDAMVCPSYRKQGLFTQMIDACKMRAYEAGVNFIFTFPGLANQGSYKAFITNQFEDKGALKTYIKTTKSFLWPRLLRRFSNKLYDLYCDNINFSKPILGELNREALIFRSLDYFNYKSFNRNHCVKLPSGSVWVSIGKFTILVGDFCVFEGYAIQQLLNDLEYYAARLGKDELIFSTSISTEIEQLESLKWDKIHQNTRLLTYDITPTGLKSYNRFNFTDIDVF